MIVGLGDSNTLPPPGKFSSWLGLNIDCSNSFQWALYPSCWNYSPSAWSQMQQFTAQANTLPLPSPTPAVGAGTSNVPVPYTPEQFQQAVNDALAAGDQQSAQNLQQWAAQQAPVSPGGGDNSFFWILGGVAVLGLFMYSRRN